MDLKKWNREAWSGLVWLRMGTGGRCLWMQWCTFGFRKMWGRCELLMKDSVACSWLVG
jgi:hypothetical protein